MSERGTVSVKVEVLEQAIEQLEAHITACGCTAGDEYDHFTRCQLCRESLDSTRVLRAAVQGSGEGGKR